MTTECNGKLFEFHPMGRREVWVNFDGGAITSGGGGLALGYEDLNDHDQLRQDPLLAVLAEKSDATGGSRVRERDRGKALAGKSTLNRLELTKAGVSEKERYKKIAMDGEAVDRLLVEIFLESYAEAPKEIVLDLDATDDPPHGNQEGRFFHGYYGEYGYLPLYIFCGDALWGGAGGPRIAMRRQDVWRKWSGS